MTKIDYDTMISIIIPVFNGEKFLRNAIDSAKNQTYHNTEIIVVDDGSTDSTSKIMMSYDGINQVFKTNGGTASALNAGIKHSHGAWIKWLSADDELYHNALEILMRLVLDRNTIHYTHYDYIDESGDVTGEFVEHDRPESELWSYFYGNGSSSIFHRDLVEKVGLFDDSLRHSEDYEYWLRATQIYGCKLYLINKKILKYRRHPDQLTNHVGGSLDSFIKEKIRKIIASKSSLPKM